MPWEDTWGSTWEDTVGEHKCETKFQMNIYGDFKKNTPRGEREWGNSKQREEQVKRELLSFCFFVLKYN